MEAIFTITEVKDLWVDRSWVLFPGDIYTFNSILSILAALMNSMCFAKKNENTKLNGVVV